MDVAQWVTLALAIWGSGLSTFVAVRQLRRDRPELKLFIHPTQHPSGRLEAAWVVKVANPKARPVEVETVALIDHEGLQASMEDPVPPVQVRIQGRVVSGLPAVLGDGESLEVVFPEPLPERWPRGAWALDSLHRLHLTEFPPKRSRSLTSLARAYRAARDLIGHTFQTSGWKERQHEREALERRAQRILDEGRITPVPPRAPLPHEERRDA